MAGALDLRLKRLQLLSLAVPLSGNNLGQVVHTHVLLSPSSKSGTGQGAVMPCGWEGNRRSGVALAMRHRLQWFIHLRAQGLRKGDEHPAYSPRWVWHNLRFFAQVQVGNETRRTYALKQMKKYHIVETHQQEHVLNEKWSMVDARSDFIIRYRLTP